MDAVLSNTSTWEPSFEESLGLEVREIHPALLVELPLAARDR